MATLPSDVAVQAMKIKGLNVGAEMWSMAFSLFFYPLLLLAAICAAAKGEGPPTLPSFCSSSKDGPFSLAARQADWSSAIYIALEEN
jgi:hypothetical protein